MLPENTSLRLYFGFHGHNQHSAEPRSVPPRGAQGPIQPFQA